MKIQVAVAQLCIVDGAWQEAPDNLGVFDEQSLFSTNPSRGNLYIIAEVAGEPEGRDELARELIETTRREYAASRGSISLALTEAIQAANTSFYNSNVTLPADQRRIAGLSAAVLREDELFIALAGPGMVCLMRGDQLTRYPETSPWFIAEERPIFDDEFKTNGALPLGKRRNFLPDLFHAILQPGDIVVLATRGLAHLLSNDELRDTLARRHPDEIIASLEDLAGAADLTVIAMRVAGEPVASIAPATVEPESIFTPLPPAEVIPEHIAPIPLAETEPAPSESLPAIEKESVPPVPQEPTEEELARERARIEQTRERNTRIRSGFLRVIAGTLGGIAGVFGRINWTSIGNASDRAIDGLVRGVARMIGFILDAVAPDTGTERAAKAKRAATPRQTAWQLIALIFPFLLIVFGGLMWFDYARGEADRAEARFIALVNESNAALTNAKQLPPEQRISSIPLTQTAINSADAALKIKPQDPRALRPLQDAQNYLMQLNGISVVNTPVPFATFDATAQLTRIVARFPDVFILDEANLRIYRVTITDAGAPATSTPAPRVILKNGDRVGGDRVASKFFDIALLDSNRLVAFDRNGAFLVYDIARNEWNGLGANDPTFWTRITAATFYTNNAYLVDPTQNQIYKYVPVADARWTSSVTYFMPDARPSLANVIDLSIDGDLWLLRDTGALLQCNQSRCNEMSIAGLDPLVKPVAAFTTPALGSLYIADAGNQRIVQIDKSTNRVARLFKASTQNPDIFKSITAFTADEQRLYVVSAGKAYTLIAPR